MSGYSIPYASDESIKESIVGYYRASSAGAEVSPEKAAEGADVSADVIKRQRAFLGEIGILNKGESGYGLTEVGQKIGRYLRHDRDDEAKAPFGEVLRSWEATEKIIDDLGSGYVSKDDVLDSIGFVTDTELDTNRQQAGANGLIGLYSWAGVLESNDDGKYRAVSVESGNQGPSDTKVSDKPGAAESNMAPEKKSHDVPNGGEVTRTLKEARNQTEVPVDISLDLTGDENPENVQKLILAIRRGVNREIDGTDGESDSEMIDEGDTGSTEDLDSFIDN